MPGSRAASIGRPETMAMSPLSCRGRWPMANIRLAIGDPPVAPRPRIRRSIIRGMRPIEITCTTPRILFDRRFCGLASLGKAGVRASSSRAGVIKGGVTLASIDQVIATTPTLKSSSLLRGGAGAFGAPRGHDHTHQGVELSRTRALRTRASIRFAPRQMERSPIA